MADARKEEELGALWIRTSRNGKEFLTGKVGGVDVVCFRNDKKQGKQPDYRVLKSQPRPDAADQRTPLDDF
jgi:uncharacterized protein (DUF736 family)